MTRHAEVRGRQRAIPALAIELLVRFGSEEPAPGGASKVFFDKAARRRLAAFAGPLAPALSQHLDVYAILGENDQVVTVAHRTKRVRRD
ncbi:MAG: hypothetical protein KDG57_07160 [Rhodoferax sp.]|nr:hypothetical protein [Rhodoferax sp.]